MAEKRKNHISDPFTLNFARDVLKARAIGDGGPKFGATMVLPKDHPFWRKLEKQLKAALKTKFGKVPENPKHWPIRDGDLVDYIEDGNNFCVFKRYEDDGAPEIVDRDMDEIIDRSEIYSGILCRVSYHVGAWSHPASGKGASCYLDNLQKLKDGKPIGRVKAKAVDDFSDWVDDEEEENEGGSALD